MNKSPKPIKKYSAHVTPVKPFRQTASLVEFATDDVEQSIPERFETIVRKCPDLIAVETPNHILTYAQLDTMANRLAQEILARRAPGPEPIALLFEKDAPLMAAMLGVLRAGKFFVLLDPAFPKARIIAVREDSQAVAVLTDAQNASLATEVAAGGGQVFEFNSTQECASVELCPVPASPDAIACVLYTSGSTGAPKGVVQSHRGVLHRVMLHANAYGIRERDRLCLLTTGTSNAVIYSFLALLNGAALLPFNVHKQGVMRLANWLTQQRISICPISSPLFRSLAETLMGNEAFPELRLIRLTSETVRKDDIDIYKRFFAPHCILVNILSSSETGPIRRYVINHGTEIADDEVPVGYPVSDKEILLLDENGAEVGFHKVGEIVVRSRYLASGYWRRPDLTQRKFKSAPQDDGRLLYFTGDLGLMLPDGLLHKGRKDFRVKVRGYGVEVEEVEKTLRGHPAIKESVVTLSEKEPGEGRLIAYYTSADDSNLSASELRRFLRHKLPEHMIPLAFVRLAAIPLTPNGKINRSALPDAETSRPELDTPYCAPTKFKEAQLARIWAEVLNLKTVGIHDNFFDLGGHSLLATRLILKIRHVFNIDLPLRVIFDAPTASSVAAYLEDAPSRPAREILPLRPVSRAGNLPLSFAQQRLWFLAQLEPSSCSYNLFSAYAMTGKLSREVLQRSLDELVRRHENLRTVYRSVDGEARQVILPSIASQIALVDAQNIAEDERNSELRRWASLEAPRRFHLDQEPLLRATLLRFSENEHVLLVASHHIVFDGWSKGILVHELLLLYEAFSAGRPSPLQDLAIQYVDFAQWQRDSLKQATLERQLSYWKDQLHDLPALQLPLDRPRPAAELGAGARLYFVINESLLTPLKTLSARHGVTLFMTLLAAYQVLLHRYTGQDDIVIGTPIAGRNHPALEALVGFFVNMLVVRADLSGNPTFRKYLARVRNVCLEAYDHQDLPFEKLVEELRPERGGSRNPLFQITFSLENSPKAELQAGRIAARELEVDPGIARFDMHMVLTEENNQLRGYLDYKTELFNRETAERSIAHFRALLEAAGANPDEPIGSLEFMSGAERRELAEWNDTRRDYPREKCIHQIFEQQVAQRPDAVAIVCEGEQLTYEELNRRSNQLARYLRDRGVGADARVGLCLKRSPLMIIALLAIIKAGGAYVSLDPAYPKDRLAFMMQDSKISLLLTQRSLSADLAGTGACIVDLDDQWLEIESGGGENLANEATADSLAYVIYTSGSTGVPKGVAVSHRNILRLLVGVAYAHLDGEKTLLHLAPLSFDASTFEIWGALLHGARCVLFPENGVTAAALEGLVRRHRISTLWLTSSLFNAIIDERPESLFGVRQLLIGGENLSISHVRRALAALPGTEIINAYGPTESTTFTCCYSIPRQLDATIPSIPIGHPLANTQVYILDRQLQPVPIGVAGELCIGGDGLARGYLNHPEMTADKFIPNAFNNEPGARLYRTGDVARYLADGAIEFIGRQDRQVKIRGFRIEPGEIESILRQHHNVRDVAVLARQDLTDEKSDNLKSKIENPESSKRLVAYVIPRDGSDLSVSELRDVLKSKLPEYMFPSAFVFVDTFPLAANGKLDRAALPDPDRVRPNIDQTFTPPRTQTEAAIAEIWSEVLQVSQIGIHDNFFELGGHSLLATQAFARLRKVFPGEVSLRILFDNPTVAGLAVKIEQLQSRLPAHEEMGRILADLEALSDNEAAELAAHGR